MCHILPCYVVIPHFSKQTNKFFPLYTMVNPRQFIYFGDFITEASIYISFVLYIIINGSTVASHLWSCGFDSHLQPSLHALPMLLGFPLGALGSSSFHRHGL